MTVFNLIDNKKLSLLQPRQNPLISIFYEDIRQNPLFDLSLSETGQKQADST